MGKISTGEMIDYVSILAKLNLSDSEKKAAGKDMERMLEYIDMLNELNTDGVEPMTHIFPISNVFREDREENGDSREKMLENAPEARDGMYRVPKTVEQ